MTNLSKAKATNVTEINSATGSNVYDEIARLNFTQELKISLFSYFTLNEKVKVNAESVLAICENDEDKFTYLNDILNCTFFILNMFSVLLYILIVLLY